jgi:hypothetical protein
LFEIGELAVRPLTIQPSRRHHAAAVGDGTVEQPRDFVELGIVGGASRIIAWNLSTITWTRGRAMFRQASAEPTIGLTRLARSRTTLRLSPGAVLALLASRMPPRMIAQRSFEHELRVEVRSNR